MGKEHDRKVSHAVRIPDPQFLETTQTNIFLPQKDSDRRVEIVDKRREVSRDDDRRVRTDRRQRDHRRGDHRDRRDDRGRERDYREREWDRGKREDSSERRRDARKRRRSDSRERQRRHRDRSDSDKSSPRRRHPSDKHDRRALSRSRDQRREDSNRHKPERHPRSNRRSIDADEEYKKRQEKKLEAQQRMAEQAEKRKLLWQSKKNVKVAADDSLKMYALAGAQDVDRAEKFLKLMGVKAGQEGEASTSGTSSYGKKSLETADKIAEGLERQYETARQLTHNSYKQGGGLGSI